jgi:hypothetical protein
VGYRGLILAVSIAGLTGLTPTLATADAGATLTVPGQVQASASATAVVQPSFSYPEATPFCTVGVDFTWDGAAWLSEFPIKNGGLCVAGGVNASAPAGHEGAGTHQVCGSAGPRYRDCKNVSVVLVSGGAAPATPKPSGLALPPPAAAPTEAPQAQPLQIPSNAPAPRVVTAAVNNLSPQQRLIGLVLLAVGVLGLLAILARRLLLSRRRKRAALPSPGQPVRRR